MEQKEFLQMIKSCRRRLNLAGFMQNLVLSLGVGACVGIVFQVLSLIVPLYYANLYMVMALLLAALTATVLAYVKRHSMEQAALKMDGFGFQERIITAYENLQVEGDLVAIQRADAIARLKAQKDKIRIPLMPSRKSLLVTLGLLAVMVGLVFVPSAVRKQAKELHEVKQEAKVKEEEVQEVLDELEELANQELTPQQQAQLQEMMESLQSTMEEYEQAESKEALASADQKLEYKYGDMSNQLADMSAALQNGGAVSPMTAEAMQAMAEKMQQMSGTQMALGQGGQSGDGQNGGQSGDGQGDGQGNGSGDGQSGDGQGDGQGNQSGEGNGSQGGQSGDGQGSGQGGQSGNGGSGDGSGGDGNGGSGEGSGTGNGRGTGSANIERDYISVPGAIADVGNLNGNASNHGNSEFFLAPNGMTWEGTHVSHEQVIGSYEQNAYEGIATGQYPTGMEDVIKEYFASFN